MCATTSNKHKRTNERTSRTTTALLVIQLRSRTTSSSETRDCIIVIVFLRISKSTIMMMVTILLVSSTKNVLLFASYSALLVAALVLGLVACFVAYRFVRWYFSPLHKLPGPNRGFWLGTFPETMQEPFLQPQFRWWDTIIAGRQDDVKLIHETEIMGDSTILCLDKNLVHMVFTGSAFGGKGGNLATTSRFHMARNYIKEIAGASIFTVEDADWARHRRILQPAFASRALKDTVSASIPSKVHRLIDCWKRACTKNDQQREIDATSHLSALALDVIGHVAFSHDFHGLDALEEWSKNQDTMENNNNSAAAAAVSQQPQLANINDKFLVAITALSQYDKLLLLCAIFGKPALYCRWSSKWQAKLKMLNDATNDIIAHAEVKNQQQEKEDNRDAGGGSSSSSKSNAYTSLLQLILKAQDPDDSVAKTRRMLNQLEVQSEVKMAMLAGFETSATTLTWGLFCLVQHPHVQEKLYEDIMKHAPPEGEDITLQHVENMEYMHAFFQEVLRLYPSIAKTERRNLKPEMIEGVLVPAGTRFRMNIALVHRHPKYWDEPESFNPDRWINVSKAEQERRRFAYMPFGAGARDCIGKTLATMEIRLVICALVRAFYIELAPSQRDTKFNLVSDIVLKMSPLLKIVVKKRNSSE